MRADGHFGAGTVLLGWSAWTSLMSPCNALIPPNSARHSTYACGRTGTLPGGRFPREQTAVCRTAEPGHSYSNRRRFVIVLMAARNIEERRLKQDAGRSSCKATGLVVVIELIGTGEARQQAAIGETPSLATRLLRLKYPSPQDHDGRYVVLVLI